MLCDQRHDAGIAPGAGRGLRAKLGVVGRAVERATPAWARWLGQPPGQPIAEQTGKREDYPVGQGKPAERLPNVVKQSSPQEIGIGMPIPVEPVEEVQRVPLVCHRHLPKQILLGRAQVVIERREFGRVDSRGDCPEEAPREVEDVAKQGHTGAPIKRRIGRVKTRRIELKTPGAMNTRRISTPGPHASSWASL